MKILMLDDFGRYTKILDILSENKENLIDYVTEYENFFPPKKNVVIHVNKREQVVLCQLCSEYELIIDTGAVVESQIECIFQYIKTKKYIYFSTMQVYGLLDSAQIMYEELISDEYFEKIRNEQALWLGSPREAYIFERLKDEWILKKKSEGICTFIILRLPKVYSREDIYQDIGWLYRRLDMQKGILMRESYFSEECMYNPIFIEDLMSVVQALVYKFPTQSKIYNIAQDDILTFGKLALIVAKCMEKKVHWYVLPDAEIDNIFEGYNIPNGNSMLLSNSKWNTEYATSYTPTLSWVKDIVKHIDFEKNEKSIIPEKEKQLIQHYKVLNRKIKKFRVVEA